MFFLKNRRGEFFAGYVLAGDFSAVMFEGQITGDRTKVHRKFDERRETPQKAWDLLCEQVVAARADGFFDAEFSSSTLMCPSEIYSDSFPMERRGVYAHVTSLSVDQFLSGHDRLEKVCAVLREEGLPVTLNGNPLGITLGLGQRVIRFGMVPDHLWESMSGKARDLCNERKMINGNLLLPSGEGLWHFQTEESALDVCVRAFLAGAMEAGAVIRLTADADWLFKPGMPYHKLHVSGLNWFQLNPALLSKVQKPVKTPAVSPISSGGWDFYL